MAKKKSKKEVLKLLPLCLFALSIVVILMGFLPGVSITSGDQTTTYNIFKLAFGGEITGLSLGSFITTSLSINFSILVCLALFLPVVGCIVKMFLSNKVGTLVVLLCFIASAVLLFIVPSISSFAASGSVLGSSGTTEATTFKDAGYSLGFGAIIGAVLSIIGGLSSAYLLVKE